MSKAKRIRPNRKKQAFLDALAQGGTMSGAANAAGVARTTPYEWRNEDQNFASAWDEAFRLGASALEDEAYRRAVTGVRRSVGRTVAFSLDPFETTTHTVEYSDRLLITLLKARDPERFCERARLAALKRKWAKEDVKSPESYEVNPAILEALERIEAEKAVATQRQFAANRMNAQRSTGPRTEEGKAISSRNALQHGLTAKQILLDGEDPDLFVELLQNLLGQFQPYRRMGEELVEHLAGTIWRLRRIPVFEAALFDCIPPDQKQSLFDGTSEVHRSRIASKIGLLKIMIPADAYAKLDRHEAHLARQVERILEQLRQLEKERPAAAVLTTPNVAFTVNTDLLGLIARMVLGLFPTAAPGDASSNTTSSHQPGPAGNTVSAAPYPR